VVDVTALAARGPQLKFGQTETLFLVSLTVRPQALPGAAAFNLQAADGEFVTQLFDNLHRDLVLVPAPTDRAGDDVDGVFTIARAQLALGAAGGPLGWPASAMPGSGLPGSVWTGTDIRSATDVAPAKMEHSDLWSDPNWKRLLLLELEDHLPGT
jgi:hypothetical protein